MDSKQALKSVAVLGAGGKMGHGISLVVLQAIAMNTAKEGNGLKNGTHELYLIDTNSTLLDNLQQYLQKYLIKYAEQHINEIREYYQTNPYLVSNEEIITTFISSAFKQVHFTGDLTKAKNVQIIFEAIIEDLNVKSNVYKQIKISPKQFLFTNTSSIPIEVLRKKSACNGNILGFHFYNPPSVQRVLEITAPLGTKPEARQLAIDLTKIFNKIPVESADVAGFIGNGYFIREVIFACHQLSELSKRLPIEESIFLLNKVTGDFLVRPMGIFQLMDYVGLDVVKSILDIMRVYLKDESFHCDIINEMVENKILGGVTGSAMMRDGFFQYANNKPIGVYSLKKQEYRPLGRWSSDIIQALGPLPESYHPWKALLGDPDRQQKIETYFTDLFKSGTPGAEVTVDFLLYSKEILELLVREGVAKNKGDVNKVLHHGFYHLFDADIPWFSFELVLKDTLCEKQKST